MKKKSTLMLGILLIASTSFLGCKKEKLNTVTESNTILTKGNRTSAVPIWQQWEKVEIFPIPNSHDQWRTYALWDANTFFFSGIAIRNGRASGRLVNIITGSPESPSGELPTIVVGQDPSEDRPFRVFAYTRPICTNTISTMTSEWSNYYFEGKDSAGETFVMTQNAFQQTNSFTPIDANQTFDIAEKFFDTTLKVKIVRVNVGITCLPNPRLVSFKITATRDTAGVLHYWVAHQNLVDQSLTGGFIDPGEGI